MEREAGSVQTLNPEKLLHLHNLTKDVSNICRKQLRSYLDALGPLLRARRLLGDLMEGTGRESVVGADRNFTELSELYQKVAQRPFDLRGQLSTPLESVATQVQMYDWEYLHEARGDRDRKVISVISPLTWVVTYSSTYSLSMLRQVLAGKQDRDQEGVRSFVLRACLIYLLFTKHRDLADLFSGLRYRMEIRKSPQTGELPLVTLSAPFVSIRPPDKLLLVATGLSGGTAFEELLDLESARRVPDPLRDQVSKILREHGEEA